MPYKSEAQRKFFNANRSELESDGVNVYHWNNSSRGMNLPVRAAETTKNLKKHATVASLAKLAATMGDPGAVSSVLADTVGQVANAANIVPCVVAGSSSFKNPRKNKEDHEDSLKTLASSRPDALSDTELRLGGPNLWQDMVWKKERDGEDLPWYKQLGGRILQNKRSGPLGKLLGYPTATLRYLLTSLMRSPHYDTSSDTAHNMMDNKSITEHELGHAIDFNSLTNKGKIP